MPDGVLEQFTRSYPGLYRFPVLVRHNGKLIVFALSAENKIVYAVLRMPDPGAPTDAATSNAAPASSLDLDAWPKGLSELIFPSEIAEVGFGVADAKRLPVFRNGKTLPEGPHTLLPPWSEKNAGEYNYFASTTARFTAAAPFQVISDGGFVYLFRQAIAAPPADDGQESLALRKAMVFVDAKGHMLISPDGKSDGLCFVTEAGKPSYLAEQDGDAVPLVNATLLVDRFVLVEDRLQPKIEVRFQRSRSKNRPASRKDSLGPRDLNGNFFYEPTQELRFVGNLTEGRFTALVLPTQVAEINRWQIFALNGRTGRIDSINVERSQDGLFNTRGTHDDAELQVVAQGARRSRSRPAVPTRERAPGDLRLAESALKFTEPTSAIKFGSPVQLGPQFTIECWVRPARPAGDPVMLIAGAAGGQGLTVRLTAEMQLQVSYGASTEYLEPKVRLLRADEWNHLAISADGAALCFYVGGRLRHKLALPTPAPASAGQITAVGAPPAASNGAAPPPAEASFSGELDELRIWDRPRGANELLADMGRRLTGLEPGLIGYWRLDEATGSPLADGATVYDQTEKNLRGIVHNASWVSSSAPIGEGSGISRDSFTVIRRAAPAPQQGDSGDAAQSAPQPFSVASGLTALLYYRQSRDLPGGYDGARKPTKQSARVMLAFAAKENGTSRPYIAALDFAVGPSGRLAQAPDTLELDLVTPAGEQGSLNERLDEVIAASRLERTLREEIARAEAAAEQVRQRLEEKISAIEAVKVKVKLWNREREPVEPLEEQYGLGEVRLDPNRRQYDTITINIPGHLQVTVHKLTSDASSTPTIVAGPKELDRWLEKFSHLTITLTREAQRELDALKKQLTSITAQKAGIQAQLDAVQSKLHGWQQLLKQGPHAEMPLRYIDANGMTVSGALLGFAWTNDPPLLFDSATGDLALYFRGSDGQLFSAYYSTFAERASYSLKDAAGAICATLIARSSDPELDKLEIRVTGDEPSSPRCTLTIHSAEIDPATGDKKLEECWQNLPRDPARLAEVLNGNAAERSYLGRGNLERREGALTLVLPQGARRAVEPGSTLVVGSRRVRAEEKPEPAGDNSAVTIKVSSNDATLSNDALPVYYLEYDYDQHASSTRVPADLYNGSRLLRAAVEPASDGGARQVALDQAVTSTPTLKTSWTAAAPGTMPVFDGQTVYATQAAGINLSRFDAPGDLTIETWARPTRFADGERARLITQRSSTSSYSLGIERLMEAQALSFNGDKDRADIVPTWSPASGQSFTVEAWVKPESSTGKQTIVARRAVIVARSWFAEPVRAIFLRLSDGLFEFGQEYGSSGPPARIAASNGDPADGGWVHVAGVFDGSSKTWQVFCNGVAGTSVSGDHAGTDHFWSIGDTPAAVEAFREGLDNSFPLPRAPFRGGIDEVRIWSRARTASELAAEMRRRAVGSEPGLVGCWRLIDGVLQDCVSGKAATLNGDPKPIDAPLPVYAPFVVAGGLVRRAQASYPMGQWAHLAAVFKQSYAVAFDGTGGYLSCGNDPSLNLTGDLTIELTLQIETLEGGHGLVSRGRFDGNDDGVPYAFYIAESGHLRLSFTNLDDDTHLLARKDYAFEEELAFFESDRPLTPGHHTVAVTRQRRSERGSTESTNIDDLKYFDQITFFIDGAKAGEHRYEAPAGTTPRRPAPIAGSNLPTEIGRDLTITDTYTQSDEPRTYKARIGGLRGTVGEVRIWNRALAPEEIGKPIRGGEAGPISWWRFAKGHGTVAEDVNGLNHAEFSGAGLRWVIAPISQSSNLTLYVNGQPVETEAANAALAPAADQFTIGALGGATPGERFCGELEELRIWRSARTHEQLLDSMFQRVTGAGEELLAHYTFDLIYREDSGGWGDPLKDWSLHGNDLAMKGTPEYLLSSAPVGADAPIVRSALAGVRTPFSLLVDGGPAVGEYADLQLDAAGLTVGVLKRCYAYIRKAKPGDVGGALCLFGGYKIGDMLSEWVGQVQFEPQLVGYIEGAPPVPSENLTYRGVSLPGDLDDYNQASYLVLQEAEESSYSFATSRDRGFDLEVEAAVRFGFASKSELGMGFITEVENTKALVGLKTNYALSTGYLEEAGRTAALRTGRSTSIELRGRYSRPGEAQLPGDLRRFIPDNMGLALVKSRTADLFALRLARNNALIGYQMRPNPNIPEDFNLISFPIDPRYIKQGTLDGKVGLHADPDYPGALNASADSSYYKPLEAYALKNRIARRELELRTTYAQFAADTLGPATSGPTHADALLAQLPALSKRSLANSYVWTADGGLFVESQESADSFSEMSGGSYAFTGMGGADLTTGYAFTKVFVGVELSALAGGHINVQFTKTQETSTSFALEVNLDRVERDIYQRDIETTEVLPDPRDPQGRRMLREPGKVDAYRFMSFLLEPDSEHFATFFSRVIDPSWLEQSDDPNAALLRKLRHDPRKPACWRVLHRVTFVSRVLPAIPADAAPSLEKTLQTLDLDSNYELIKELEPYLSGSFDSFAAFRSAIEATLRTRLPELLPHRQAIVEFMSLYYGIVQGERFDVEWPEEQLPDDGALDAPPSVVVSEMNLTVGRSQGLATAELNARVSDDRLTQLEQILVTWECVEGPQGAQVTFEDRHSPNTNASFDRRGRYLLRITADDGRNTAYDELTVVVNDPPRISAGQELELTERTTTLQGRIIDSGLGDEDTGELTLTWSTVGSLSKVRFEPENVLEPNVTFESRGIFLLKLTADNGTFTTEDYVRIAVAARALEGLQVLYSFGHSSADWVPDVSGVHPPLDLTLPAGLAPTDGKLQLTPSATLATTGPADRLTDALQESGELTVEAWLTPALATQTGLARIITLSSGPGTRSLILGQAHGTFYVAIRTSATNANGSDRALSAGNVEADKLIHVVCTRDRSGRACVYLNGELATEREIPGELTAWDKAAVLTLGGEAASGGGGSGWSGTLHLVAIYSRALSAEEVRRNYEVGADEDLPPIVNAGEDRVINWAGEPPVRVELAGRVTHDRASPKGSIRWELVGNLASSVIFSDATKPTTEASFEREGVYQLRLTADDGVSILSDEVKIAVNLPPVVEIAALKPVPLTGAAATVKLEATISRRLVTSPSDSPAIAWRMLEGPESCTLASPDAATTEVTFMELGEYSFEVTVTEGVDSSLVARAQVNVTVVEAPQVNPGPDRVLLLPAFMGDATLEPLAGETAVVEPGVDGQPMTVRLELAGQVEHTGLADNNAQIDTLWKAPKEVRIEAPDQLVTVAHLPKRSGVYRLSLYADNGTLAAERALVVTLNQAPVVDAGADCAATDLEAALQATVYDDGLPQEPGKLELVWSKLAGPGGVSFTPPDSDYTRARFTRSGEYELAFSASDGTAKVTDRLRVTVPVPRRVADGLLALYTFEDVGATIPDRSGNGGPELTIADLNKVRQEGGSLTIVGETLITTSGPATAMIDAIASGPQASGAVTIELWLRPALLDTPGQWSRRIVTISSDYEHRNLTLAQQDGDYYFRVRTGPKDLNGSNYERWLRKAVKLDRVTHLVLTLQPAAGGGLAVQAYLNGEAAPLDPDKPLAGSLLTAWDNTYRLALANELMGDRGWAGAYSLVAIYGRALTPAEVQQNYEAWRMRMAGEADTAAVPSSQ